MNKATDLYHENVRLYNKLTATKSTIPSVEQLKENQLKNMVLRKKLSNYDVSNRRQQPSLTY